MKKHTPLLIESVGHLLFWTFYVVYPVLIFGKASCFRFDLIKSLVDIATIGIPSYVIYFFLLKNIKNPVYWIILLILTGITIYFVCTYDCVCNLKYCAINKMIGLIFVSSLFIAIFFIKRNITHIKSLAHAEQARVDAELKALKAQINPHFLFNTLNMLYSDAIAVNEDIADKILKLSDNLHYLIHEGQKKEILLETEVHFIENYLVLQKSRIGDRVDIQFHVHIDDQSQLIPPLLFIPFIENAFKYSSMLEGKEAPVLIDIHSSKGIISLKVSNKFNAKYRENQKKEWKDSGIGIENVKQRLEILFPSRHEIKITENEDQFLVNLIINTR
ncbi:sensor histidine kinase [Chryseobacterium arthrosphaerae]|uniref:sensor histidine kinase n=1 Tax=Chryseobacterium arthrosphaerae TaxID=651561 RepID=UPI001F4B3FF4|nr:sensor histidine kinase [Chryseobacterium arthrosphaerae]MDG4653228.1 sensor histidine kinase [Chryseobacterium arthrosphaerae]